MHVYPPPYKNPQQTHTEVNTQVISIRELLMWIGVTTAWVIPLGVLIYLEISWVVYAVFVAYIIQMTVSGTLLFRKYKAGMRAIRASGDDYQFNMRWFKGGTIVLIAYCVAAFVATLMPPLAHNIFTMLTVASVIFFSSRFTAFFDNVLQSVQLASPACVEQKNEVVTDDDQRREEHCRQVVDAWINSKGFCDTDPDRDSAADKMGLDRIDFLWYLSVCLKTEFRSWRVKLRIEEAKSILSANPDAPINELARSLGFNSRGNFFTYFKKYTGERTSEYIARIHSK